MRVWREQFGAYHLASQIGGEEPKIQLAFVKATLDIELQRELTGRVELTDEMDIESIVDKVEEIFKERYPIFTRRWRLFSARQSSKQTFTSWHTGLRLMMQEVDMETMSLEELKTSIIISLTTDSELLDRFLKKKDPTEEDLLEEAQAYESQVKVKEGIKAVENPGYAEFKANKVAKQEEKVGEAQKFTGKCNRCTQSGHMFANCPVSKTVVCKTCGRK